MRLKALLLQSVSAVATVAAAGNAQAASPLASNDSASNGYTFSVQGGLLLSASELSLAGVEQDKIGSGATYTDLNDAPDDVGYNAAFSIGKQIDNTWDVRFGASLNKLIENGSELYASGGSSYHSPMTGSGASGSSYSYQDWLSQNASFGFETMDFEVGYSPTLDGNLSVRLFAGIRALHFTNNFSGQFIGQGSTNYHGSGAGGSGFYSGSYGGMFSSHREFTSEFFGAGPRLGTSISTRFAGTNFGLSGTVAGTVAYGRQTDTSSSGYTSSWYSSHYTASGGIGSGSTSSYNSGSYTSPTYTSTETTNKLVVDVQAQAGVDYYLNDTSVLTFGYQAEKLFNVGPGNDSGDNKLVHGPFLKLSGSFD